MTCLAGFLGKQIPVLATVSVNIQLGACMGQYKLNINSMRVLSAQFSTDNLSAPLKSANFSLEEISLQVVTFVVILYTVTRSWAYYVINFTLSLKSLPLSTLGALEFLYLLSPPSEPLRSKRYGQRMKKSKI